jgi:propanol-preferring alcohol dehydrogenase
VFICNNLPNARIVKPKEPLEVQEPETPKPKGSQVLIKVQSLGVCHSDIHLWEGGYEGIAEQRKTDRGVKYPLTPGHEIAGVVVLVFPWMGKGLCPASHRWNANQEP